MGNQVIVIVKLRIFLHLVKFQTMRNIITIISIALFFTACKNEKKGEVTVTSEDGKTTTTMNVDAMQKQSDKMQEQMEELQKMTPVTMDELKALLPDELMGAKRTNRQVTTAAGTGMATAEYRVNDSTDLRVSIWDCGGPGGAGIYSMQYMTMYNYESESEDEYTKTVEFDGKRGFEQCSKVRNDCKLTFFGGKRYLVALEGDNIGAAALKEVAGKLVD